MGRLFTIKADQVATLDNKYLTVAPEVVIEIDTKAELAEVRNPLGYYQEKTDELIAFGVEKVIWIFTDTKKVMIAEKNNKWEIGSWSIDIEIFEGLPVNIEGIVGQWSDEKEEV